MNAKDPRVVVWRKSSHSNHAGECVEVARLDAKIGLRDSKAPDAGHLSVSTETMKGLLGRIKAGELDLR